MQQSRRTLLINRKFQLKFTLFVCSWVLILSLSLPFGLWAGLNGLTENLAKNLSPEALQQIQKFHLQVFQVYSLAALIATAVLFWMCLILSHRIAGPIFRIQTAMNRWKRGNIEHQLKLREHDHFQELADAYNASAQEYIDLRNQVRESCEKLEFMAKELELKHRTQVQEIVGGLQCGNKNTAL